MRGGIYAFHVWLIILCWSCRRGQLRAVVVADELKVGVILDKGSDSWVELGRRIEWRCITMAVDDFYAAHPNYSSRLSLHLRDTHQDSISAASAAVDLVKNVAVEAIIGPQTTTQAKFVAELGNKTQVPILSFSSSQIASSLENPYFIRTSWHDSTQAQVIASLVEAFNWTEVVPVFQDSDDGDSFVPLLVDALQQVSARVSYKTAIPVSANTSQLQKELEKLNARRTRVFVVHMSSYSLALQLFSAANHAGMMGKEYVWITTYGLTDLIDLMGSSAATLMRGVIGVKPYVGETEKLRQLRARWRRKPRKFQQHDTQTNLSEPTVLGLWAYDTVWALAMAAEAVHALNSSFIDQRSSNATDNKFTDLGRLAVSLRGSKLRETILNTTFDGVTGRFQLVRGQVLKSNWSEIINVVDHGRRRVGFWTPDHGISRYFNANADLENITWPGGDTKPPKGWQWPTEGKELLIGVPVKPGFPQFVRNNASGVDGYCIRVFNAVMNELPYHVPFNYVIFANQNGESNGTYDELVYQVYLEKYDAVVGDVTIRANRSQYVDFTLPFTESGVYMVVPIKDSRRKDAWAFMKPLTPKLWIASGAFFVFTGCVVWLLEHRINDEFNSGQASDQIGKVFYFSFSTLVFKHKEKIVSNLTKIVVITWVFVVIVLQSSYTASLSSMLTVQQLQPTVSDIDQLLRDGSYVGYLKDSFMPNLLKQLNFNETKIIAYESPEDYHNALINGSVAAIVDEIPYLKVFLSKFCNKKFTMIGPVLKTGGFGFAFPKGSPLVSDVSKAITKAIWNNTTKDLENKYLYEDQSCFDPDTDTVSSRLTVNSFWGLFLISGATCIAAVIIHLIVFLHQQWRTLKECAQGSVLKWLTMLAKLYVQTIDSSLHDSQEPKPGIQVAATDDLPDFPGTDSGWQTPSSLPNQAQEFTGFDDDTESPAEGEGTPGREISRQSDASPSFADMLN